MSSMSHLDIPVLRSCGFTAGLSGHSWFNKDRDGMEWVVSMTDRDNNLLMFTNLTTHQSTYMDRDKFSKTFWMQL